MTQKTHFSRLWGAILLIAGTTIGAGVLALPVASGRAGFHLSIATMVGVWLYLTYAAFCMLEANLAVGTKSNIISMATETLGRFGKVISWSAYLFLLYALNTAYVAGSTSLFQVLSINIFGAEINGFFCVIPLLGVFALLLRQGMKLIDRINRIMMVGLVLSFFALVGLSLSHIQLSNLELFQPEYILLSLSTMVTAFGFQIIIPSLVNYLHGDVQALKKAIWIGSAIPLVAYIIWQLTILGTVPQVGEISIEVAYHKGLSGADLLAEFTHLPAIKWLALAFAFFAILTSFLGVSISLFDFLADGFHSEKRAQSKWKLFFFTFVPPLYFALTSSRVFFTALEYAGAFGVVTLLALLPGLMVWRRRYALKMPSSYQVGGGKPLLILFILVSVVIIALEVLRKVGVVA